MRFAGLAVIGLALFLSAGSAAGQSSSAAVTAAQPAAANRAPTPEQAQLLKSTETFVRNLFSWGPEFQVKLGPLTPSVAPDFYTVIVNVTVNGQSDAAAFYVSKDGKIFMRGDLYDMSADPFAENRAKLHTDGAPSYGPADAPITLVEFSDFECPHCRELYRAMKTIGPKYPMIRVVFKDFPISQIHPWAETAAIGAHCAFVQNPDAFWAIHDSIFENQDVVSSENVWEKLQDFARHAGLDPDALRACLASLDARKAVQANLAEGQSLGVNSTPTVFVNGRPVYGGDKTQLEQHLNYQLQLLHLSPGSSTSVSDAHAAHASKKP